MTAVQDADDDFLALNFLIGGSSPEKIRASRRRRTNMINTFSDSDAVGPNAVSDFYKVPNPPRHPSGNSVAYADGHAAFVK